MRPPLMKLSAGELSRLRAALNQAGIGRDGAMPLAAE
jgi:4-hydroxy-tetrahydrodipicolinate synthase